MEPFPVLQSLLLLLRPAAVDGSLNPTPQQSGSPSAGGILTRTLGKDAKPAAVVAVPLSQSATLLEQGIPPI